MIHYLCITLFLMCCVVFFSFYNIYFYLFLLQSLLFSSSAVLGFSCTFSRSFSCQVKLFISDSSCFLRSSCMLYISVIGQHFLAKLGEAVKGFIPLCSQCVCVRVCVCMCVCVCVCERERSSDSTSTQHQEGVHCFPMLSLTLMLWFGLRQWPPPRLWTCFGLLIPV